MSAGALDEGAKSRAAMPLWVRLVWWPFMIVSTIGAIGSAVQAVYLMETGEPVRALLAGIFGVGLGVVLGREWPHWREL